MRFSEAVSEMVISGNWFRVDTVECVNVRYAYRGNNYVSLLLGHEDKGIKQITEFDLAEIEGDWHMVDVLLDAPQNDVLRILCEGKTIVNKRSKVMFRIYLDETKIMCVESKVGKSDWAKSSISVAHFIRDLYHYIP